MAKTLMVDSVKCIGCGTCVALAPKTFKLNDDGKSQVIEQFKDDEQTIQSAIDGCPVKAISWKK